MKITDLAACSVFPRKGDKEAEQRVQTVVYVGAYLT